MKYSQKDLTKFFFLTNIPTPYRNHFFNQVCKYLSSKNIKTKVYFMAETERERHWNYKEWDIKYPYNFSKDFGLEFRRVKAHFNPSVLFKIKRDKPDILIIAGGWQLPTVILLMVLKPLFRNTTMAFWNEGNFVDEIFSRKGIFKKLKKFVYNRFDFIVSSGKNSDKLISHYVEKPKIIRLVNVIDDSKFTVSNKEYSSYQPSYPRVIFIVAQINERKNIYFFLQAVSTLLKEEKCVIRIAGTGEDKEKIKKWIVREELQQKVVLLGQISGQEVITEAKGADIFCLPSLRDPFPLSLIEASFMAKPLLISNRIGSVPEITCGTNAFLFDPTDSIDILNQTRAICDLSNEGLKEYGSNSKAHARNNFVSEMVTRKFIEDSLQMVTSIRK